jgi:hypothetical protein
MQIAGGAAVVAAACNLSDPFNGIDSSGGFGGGGPSSSSGSSVPPGSTRTFPCDHAAEGGTCSIDTTCEVGDAANPACNAQLTCTGLYQWEDPGRQHETCATDCPGAFSPTAPEATCRQPLSYTLICEYEEGTCGCAPVLPDGGLADADASDADAEAGGDADFDAASLTYAWTCVKPAAGCPHRRPRIGAPCVRPMTCDYGACVFMDGIAVTCNGGDSWVESGGPHLRACP